MMIDLNAEDIELLLTSLEYSKRAVRDAEGTPDSVRQEQLRHLDDAAAKLRDGRASVKASRV